MHFKIGQFMAVEGECCGYIAEAIYAKQTLGRSVGGTDPQIDAIRTRAFAIGESVVRGTYLIPDSDWEDLKSLVASANLYKKLMRPIISDGIKWKPSLTKE